VLTVQEVVQHELSVQLAPSVFARNLQYEPVRNVGTREECHWSHAWQRFKRSTGVKLNGIIECKFLSKNADRTAIADLSFFHNPIPTVRRSFA
jgi:hypothetical protein